LLGQFRFSGLRTGRKHDALFGLALGLALILSPSGAKADGLVVRMKQTQGPFIVTIFTPPEASRDLPTEVTVMIQRRDSGEVVMDAAVELRFVPPAGAKLSPNDVLCGPTQNLPSPESTATAGQRASIRAPRDQAANKLFYGIPVVFRAAGNWQLQATIRQGGEEASVACTLPVGIPHRLRGLWPYLALPPVAIALFAMNQWLRRRTAKDVWVRVEPKGPGTANFVTRSNAGEGLTASDVSGFGQYQNAKLRHTQNEALAIQLKK
jgi:hypothetical protein